MKLWLDEEGIRRLGLYEFLINPAERQKALASAFWASRKGLKGEVWLGNAKASSLQCAFNIRYAKYHCQEPCNHCRAFLTFSIE